MTSISMGKYSDALSTKDKLSMASLLPLGIVAAGSWFLVSYAHSMKRDARLEQEKAAQVPIAEEPFQGAVGHIKDRIFADNRGIFTSVQEDYDVNGARIFFVDYGNGQRVVQYFDPRILL